MFLGCDAFRYGAPPDTTGRGAIINIQRTALNVIQNQKNYRIKILFAQAETSEEKWLRYLVTMTMPQY